MTDTPGTRPRDIASETLNAYLDHTEHADSWYLLDNMTADELRELAKIAIRLLDIKPCRYGDATCPCQDGDACHYVGPDAMNPSSEIDRLAGALMAHWNVPPSDEDAYDTAVGDLLAIPDGWAKADGRWVFIPNEHIVTFGPERWALAHPLSCRLDGNLIGCPFHAAIARVASEDGIDTDEFGDWIVSSIVGGEPELERVRA